MLYNLPEGKTRFFLKATRFCLILQALLPQRSTEKLNVIDMIVKRNSAKPIKLSR